LDRKDFSFVAFGPLPIFHSLRPSTPLQLETSELFHPFPSNFEIQEKSKAENDEKGSQKRFHLELVIKHFLSVNTDFQLKNPTLLRNVQTFSDL
jgi:hypothetical protein